MGTKWALEFSTTSPYHLTNINIGDAIYRINEKFLTDLSPYSDKLPEPEVGGSESLLAY